MDLEKELQVFNRISFVEGTHNYLIDNQITNDLSVTRLIKKFKRQFQQEEMAVRVAKKLNTTVQHVLAEWEMNRLYSTTIGTALHKYIECFYTKQPFDVNINSELLGFDEKEKIKKNLPIMVKYFQNFYNANPHYKCIKNEFVLGDLDDTKICGTADMLCLNTETNCVEIFDFKTNKKLNKSSKYSKLFYPFDDMDECEINEYTIQLNTYKYFIEKYTKLKVGDMKLVWLQPTNNDYELISLPSIQDRVKLMLERFKATSLFEV